MSPGLTTQLAEYGTYCEERQGAVSADDILGPLPAMTPPAVPARRWLVAATAAVAVLVLIGGAAWLVSGRDAVAPADQPIPSLEPITPEITDVPTPEITNVLGVGGRDGVVLDGALWVVDDAGTLSRIDASTREVTHRTAISAMDSSRIGVDAVDGAIWVSTDESLWRISATTGEVTGAITIGGEFVAETDDALWVSTVDQIVQIDPTSLEVVQTYEVAGGMWWTVVVDGVIWGYNPDGLTGFDLDARRAIDTFISPAGTTEAVGVVADGAIWVPGGNDITRFDLTSFEFTDRVVIGEGPGDLLHHDGALWMHVPLQNSVVRVDLDSLKVTEVTRFPPPNDDIPHSERLTPSGGLIWVRDSDIDTITAVDPTSGQVVATINIGDDINRLVSTGDALWVITTNAVTRIQNG